MLDPFGLQPLRLIRETKQFLVFFGAESPGTAPIHQNPVPLGDLHRQTPIDGKQQL
jgi:hypothetical protein